jgi:hypothetical protein
MSGLGIGEPVRRPQIFSIVAGIPKMKLFQGAPNIHLTFAQCSERKRQLTNKKVKSGMSRCLNASMWRCKDIISIFGGGAVGNLGFLLFKSLAKDPPGFRFL